MTFIIAEAGVNHNGKLAEAAKLVWAAKDAGADAVKFQAFESQKLWGDDRIAHLELDRDEMTILAEHCGKVGIEFMATPFDVDAVGFLRPLVKRYKVASGCIARKPLLQAVGRMGVPIILSTGMATMEDVAIADRILAHEGVKDLTLLHCTSAYPCPMAEVNLGCMHALALKFHRPIGYSDHTEGTCVSVAAVAWGATVIEKHLTLDRHAEGPDHKASIEPQDFKRMVEDIRSIEAAMGSMTKTPQPSEELCRKLWRTA